MSRRVANWPAEDAERRKAERGVEKSRPCCWDNRRATVDVKNGRDMSEYVQESPGSRDGENKPGLSINVSFHDPSDGRGLVSSAAVRLVSSGGKQWQNTEKSKGSELAGKKGDFFWLVSRLDCLTRDIDQISQDWNGLWCKWTFSKWVRGSISAISSLVPHFTTRMISEPTRGNMLKH